MLVGYSDSEGSDEEQPKQAVTKATKSTTQSSSNFAVDRSTGKIKVNLQSKPDPTSNGTHEDEPAAKRPRLGAAGGGVFSGFNAMLPAPKRDNLQVAQVGTTKTAARKVFSLRTGAEPAFSRESDAELRELFAEQSADQTSTEPKAEVKIPLNIPKPSFAKPAPPAPAGKAFMFKPLSVARNTKKKRPTNETPISTAPIPSTKLQPIRDRLKEPSAISEPPKKKANLFSAETDETPFIPQPTEDEDEDEAEDEIIEDLGPVEAGSSYDSFQPVSHPPSGQSLDSIADDLNLSAAERRQLFGRNNRDGNAINVVNFNTDAEWAANQQLIAAGEQVQHNPVRAIASGKHSLRQLVSSAANQKEALEESFATGKRNKREAGNRYGW